ncbi:MAG: glycoside hydrolase family 3 C-terminal domain-containing protein [Prevotella sp.]|nr:glycoside hydrolase family 3 C-terminal domain-containing protein [Prevotella sp.]
MLKRRYLACILLAFTAVAVISAQGYSFQNTKLRDDQRVEQLLRQLTLDEKLSLLSTNLGVPRLGIPSYGSYEGLHGLALGGPAMNNGKKTVDGKEVANDLPTTMFPQAYGLGCTWDREAVRQVGSQMADEVRYYIHRANARRKGLVLYAPNADLARDPRWGRTEESYGEDPFLTAQLTVAMVRGVQGNHPRYWKAAALMKHFLANSNEDGRDSTSSNFDERLFREYYSYPFYKGITEGGSRAFMAAYNAWNGTPMCINPCLEQVARREWGNNGIICTDGGGLRLLVEAHKAFPTLAEGSAAVIKATTGMFLDQYLPHVQEALKKGLITEADIDRAIRGNLFVMLRLGLLDGERTLNPYATMGTDSTQQPFAKEAARQLARDVTCKSIVLLKNEGLLPLRLHAVKQIAVVGPYADNIIQDWYSGTPPYQVTILNALREAGKELGFEVTYAPDNQMGRAEAMAHEADIVIYCTGNHPFGTRPDWKFCPVPSDGREANDRHSLLLPDEDVLRRLKAANPNTVLVLVSSFPYAINWSDSHLPAILHVTHCSQEQGHAVADVLLGRYNPAGRTTQTWVRDICELPPMMDYDIHHGRTYMYYRGNPLYPFGYGLSYSRFEYGQARVTKQDKKHVTIAVPVTNCGPYDGDEVVQLYATYPDSNINMPHQQLRAFERVSIAAGQTREVLLNVSRRDLTYWNVESHAFVPVPGIVRFDIGSSSADLRTFVNIKN